MYLQYDNVNRKTIHAPHFPGTNHDVIANFQYTVELFNLEAGHPVKMEYRLRIVSRSKSG